jgi:hypothetical protein
LWSKEFLLSLGSHATFIFIFPNLVHWTHVFAVATIARTLAIAVSIWRMDLENGSPFVAAVSETSATTLNLAGAFTTTTTTTTTSAVVPKAATSTTSIFAIRHDISESATTLGLAGAFTTSATNWHFSLTSAS